MTQGGEGRARDAHFAKGCALALPSCGRGPVQKGSIDSN